MRESRYNVWADAGGSAYVFNGVSGALLGLAAADYHAVRRLLSGGGTQGCRPNVLARLVEGMMLVPDDANELELLRTRYRVSRHQETSFALTIVTSLGCNFECPYCFEDKQPSIMAPETQAHVLALLEEQLAQGVKSFRVTWFGGEPLVGKRSLLALLDGFVERCHLAGASYDASITTNGYLLDEETCAQLRDRHVHSAQVCLDGPPLVHDAMRPLTGSRESFWRIVENLHHAIRYMAVSVRVNLDAQNLRTADELMRILVAEGFSGKIRVYPAQIVATDDGVPSPSASYRPRCLTSEAFARAELEFLAMARHYGFSGPSLPSPVGTPCTAVRVNELVVGSEGELYKCWASVGNRAEAVGHIRDHRATNGRLAKWLDYDPFADPECLGCVALPVCMGGCAHHAMDPRQRANRCGTFRHTYREQVRAFVATTDQYGRLAGEEPGREDRRDPEV
jgi:uncharacterized protein